MTQKTHSAALIADEPKPTLNIYLILLLGIVSVSFAAIIIRYAQNNAVPSMLIAAARLMIAAVLLTPLTLPKYLPEIRQLRAKEWGLATLSGIFLALHFAFWVSSLEYTSVLISVTLVTTTPIWAALFEWIGLKSKISRPVFIGMVVAILGGLFIGIPSETVSAAPPAGNNLVLGAVLAIGGAIAVSLYLTMGRSLRRTVSLLPYIWIVYSIAGVVMTVVVVLMQIPVLGYSTEAYLWLLALGTIPQLIGHSALNYVVKYLSATYISIATKLEPIGSAAVAYFAFAELPSIWHIVGSFVILIGVLMATRPAPNKSPTSTAE